MIKHIAIYDKFAKIFDEYLESLLQQEGPRSVPGEVRKLLRLRRNRERKFGAQLFGDPAWDILLDLYLAEIEQRNVSVSSLCIAAHVPATTALRSITLMERHDLLERHPDPKDRRRVWIKLSPDAFRQLEALLQSWAGSGVPDLTILG